MFRNLMTKIKTDLERDQSSNNGSICSSVSSSQIDLTDAIRPSKQSILETVFSESNEDKLSNKNFSIRTSDYLTNDLNHEQSLESSDDVKSTQSSQIEQNTSKNPLNFEEPKLGPILNHALDEENVFLDYLETDSNKVLQENQLLRKKLSFLQPIVDKVDYFEKENFNFSCELKLLRKQNQDLIEKNEELKKSNMDNEERNTKLLNKMDELKEKNRQLIDKNKDLLDKNKQLKDKQDVLIKNIDHLEISFAKVSKEKLALEERLEKLGKQTWPNDHDKQDENELLVGQLQERITKLEETLTEKNKTIRLQNQRIHDIKKSVQKGDLFLRDEKHNQDPEFTDSGFNSGDQMNRNELQKQIKQVTNIPNSNSNHTPTMNSKKDYQTHVNDINFQYLHNVIFKFITSYDYEAQKQLVKAISTLLQFSEEEERIVKQRLQEKGSWFRLSENFKF